MCKTFAMTDASNTVEILVACGMQAIRCSSINCVRCGGTKQMGCQMMACGMFSIQFTQMNCLWWGGITKTGRQMKVCVIYGMRFTRMNCLHWDKRIETVQYNKMCVIRGKHVCNQKCVQRPMIPHKYRGSQQLLRVEYSTQIYWFDTRGAKEYSQVLAAELSIQPHLET